MEACNAYYYATRDPLGAAGDFTTAPEISQMFGEMVGAALGDVWKRAGAPADAIYAELGPGRGTLASDALRVLRSVGFARRSRISSKRARSCATHSERRCRTRICTIASRTFPPSRCCWSPTNSSMHFRFGSSSAGSSDGRDRRRRPRLRPRRRDRRRFPARDEAVARYCELLVANGGVALIIDYGHERSAPGDTLQAVRGHRFAPVLDRPGRTGPDRACRFRGGRADGARSGRRGHGRGHPGRMADPPRHRSARAGAVARQSRPRA